MYERESSHVGKMLAGLGLMLALILGCRTPQPYLKPPIGPEELNVPPNEARFDKPDLPTELMIQDEIKKKPKDFDPKKDPSNPSGMGGMGGMGGMQGGPGH